eukprot:m.167722 g.167722  ORF g.167722 m.167722 type:complete len:316 (-) comp17200_c1_seq2:60-1007(-)
MDRPSEKPRAFSPASFYGSTSKSKRALTERDRRRQGWWSAKLAGLTAVSAREQDAVLHSIAEAGSVWHVCSRQEDAFRWQASCVQSVHVFSFEKDGLEQGRRRFLVTDYDTFWRRYSRMPARLRHYYEVIPEGQPCHLYFDLEFPRACNPASDGEAMVTCFKALLCREVERVFLARCDLSAILDLDSSTASKFSRHLIVHLPESAFRSNQHAGFFAHHLSRCAETEFADLMVVTLDAESKQRGTFLDLGVYSRNRNFRLYLSTKLGKTASLVRAAACTFVLPGSSSLSSLTSSAHAAGGVLPPLPPPPPPPRLPS